MKKETKERNTAKERIVVLEKGKAIDEDIDLQLFSCCSTTLFPLRFW